MSHDVDWRRQGASVEHIMSRKERFDPETIKDVHIKNPYYNIPNYMYLEDKFNIKSNFFFTKIYENRNYKDNEMTLKNYIKEDGKSDFIVTPHQLMIILK